VAVQAGGGCLARRDKRDQSARIRGRMPAEQMVEAAVLHHHDYNVIDRGSPGVRRQGMPIFRLDERR